MHGGMGVGVRVRVGVGKGAQGVEGRPILQQPASLIQAVCDRASIVKLQAYYDVSLKTGRPEGIVAGVPPTEYHKINHLIARFS